MISPDFFSDDKICEVEPAARLMFIGLWVLADDKGNMKRSAHQIRRSLFADDRDITPGVITGWLERFVELGLIGYYTVGREDYLTIRNFLRYQHINRPSGTTIPEPPSDLFKVRQNGRNHVSVENNSARFSEPSVIPHVNVVSLADEESTSYGDSVSAHGGLSEDSVSPLPEEKLKLRASEVPKCVVLDNSFKGSNGEDGANGHALTPPKGEEKVNGHARESEEQTDQSVGEGTGALSAEQLAKSNLTVYASRILVNLGLHCTSPMVAVVTDAMLKHQREHSKGFAVAAQEIMLRAAVAQHDAPPENWIVWFRDGGWKGS